MMRLQAMASIPQFGADNRGKNRSFNFVHSQRLTQREEAGFRYLREGRNEMAEAAFDEAMTIAQQRGEKTPAVALCLSNMGIVYRAMGVLSSAEKAFRRCLGISRETMHPSDPLWPQTLFDLADILLKQGKAEEARPLLKEALGKMLSQNHGNTKLLGKVATSLAEVYTTLGDPDNAERCQRIANQAGHYTTE
jgi:tetratricopeptide (TPR) repeat protein